MKADNDDDYYSAIHPPNVVLVSSNPASPGSNRHSRSLLDNNHGLCSPLSSAPNSPGRQHDDESDDESDTEDEEEIRLEEIEKLLKVPPSPILNLKGGHVRSRPFTTSRVSGSPQKNNAGHSEVPFDEGNHHPAATTEAPADELMTNDPPLAVVTPESSETPEIVEDIDAYEESDEEEEEKEDELTKQPSYHQNTSSGNNHRRMNSEEKKLDDSITPPRSTGASTGKYDNSGFNLANSMDKRSYSHSSIPADCDSVPHDERIEVRIEQTTMAAAEPKAAAAAAGGTITNQKHDTMNTVTPKTKALKTAEREIQEMGERVQQMLEQRRRTSQQSQQRTFVDEQVHQRVEQLPHSDESAEVAGEPPSLSPRGSRKVKSNCDVHTSLDSGCSSYYYDGSVLDSGTGTTSYEGGSDMNNTTINTTNTAISELAALQKANPGTARDLTRDYLAAVRKMNTSRNTTLDDLPPQPLVNATDDSKTASSTEKLLSTSFEDFTGTFDQEAHKGSFAKAMSDTSRAFSQVSEDVAKFLAIPSFPTQQQQSKKTIVDKGPGRLSPPMSPSSDCTEQLANLSPIPNSHRDLNSSSHAGATHDDPLDAEDIMRLRSSYKVERARSLVQSRLSPTNVGSPVTANAAGNIERARQVMSKREQEQRQQQASSKAVTSASAVRTSSSSAMPTRSNVNGSRTESNSSLNIPGPPSLSRIAALVEGFGGVLKDTANSQKATNTAVTNTDADTDWPTSLSQLMEEYHAAITESLRNLSTEEIAGLAQNGGASQESSELAGATRNLPGISISPTRSYENRCAVNQDASQKEYDGMIADLTMPCGLRMPDLDHSPPEDALRSTNAQDGSDYGLGKAGVLQYDAGEEYEYHENDDGHDQKAGFDDFQDRHERAAFATQLSEKLLNLPQNLSIDTSGSFPSESPQKSLAPNDTTFNSKESDDVISPPKRRNPAYDNQASTTNMAESAESDGVVFISSLQQRKCLPTSGQPSVCSDGHSPVRENAACKDKKSHSSTDVNTSTGSVSSLSKPTMVEGIDNETGIAKGDVMLSLLCDNSLQASKEKPESWAWRVREAIWRSRDMRKNIFQDDFAAEDNDSDSPQARRSSSLPVDVDDVRVVGGIGNVGSIQSKALSHLKRNEFEQSLELYEDIIFNYYSFFEQVLAKRDELSSEDITHELSNFKPYIGASLHNLGIIHLLKGDYEDAFSFFKRAVDNRRACLGEEHPDCIVSTSFWYRSVTVFLIGRHSNLISTSFFIHFADFFGPSGDKSVCHGQLCRCTHESGNGSCLGREQSPHYE